MKILIKVVKRIFVVVMLMDIFVFNYSAKASVFTTFDDLQDKRIGILLGGSSETIVNKVFPNAEIMYFNDLMDAVTALLAGKVDSAVVSYPVAFMCSKNVPEIIQMNETLNDAYAGIGIKKGNTELLHDVNVCLDELKQNGILDDMEKRWYNFTDSEYAMPDLVSPVTGETIRVGVAADREPACFLTANGEVYGFDGELARRIAISMGRQVEFIDMKFSALISALDSGKVDMIVSNVIITEEKEQMIDFSQPYFNTPVVMLVKKGK